MDQPDRSDQDRLTLAPGKPEPKGFINPRIVKIVSFSLISLSLLACTLLSILAVWKFISDTDTVWRAFATMLIIGFSSWTFAIVNERFGD